MRMLKKSALAALMCGALMTTGCLSTTQTSSNAGTGYSNGAYDDDDVSSTLKHEDASFFSASGATACAVGAGIAMLGTLIMGKDHAKNFAILGAAGCALGMGANYLLDNVRANYATTEEQLDATKTQVENQLEIARNLHEASSQAVKDDEKAVKQLKKDYKKGKTDYASLENKNRELNANIQYLTAQKEKAENNLTQINSAREGVVSDAGGQDALTAEQSRKLKELDSEIAALKSEIDAINSNIVAYSEQRNSLLAG